MRIYFLRNFVSEAHSAGSINVHNVLIMFSNFKNLSNFVPFPWGFSQFGFGCAHGHPRLVMVAARCVQTSAPWHGGVTFTGTLLWQIGSPARQGVGGISLVALAQSL